MTEIERLKKRAERYRQLNVGNRAKVWRLKEACKEKDAEVERLEREVKSLVEIIEPGSWK